MDKNAVVSLALDINNGVKTFSFEDKTYSAREAEDVLRQALIEANGGSANFDYKALRRNKVEIFEIIEELIPQIVNEGLTGNEFWNTNVDYRNIALGDKNEFYVEDDTDFVVSIIADGIATPRRQRLVGGSRVPVDTQIHAIRIYEEFTRFMAGIIDWNKLCDKVAEAFQKAIWNDIYTAFAGTVDAAAYSDDSETSTPGVYGSIDEDDVIDMINHVEAATGKTAKIIGTQAALKALAAATTANFISAAEKEDMYNQGYIGKFYGTDCYKLKQIHNPGGSTFALSDKEFYVIASDDKFIKFVDVTVDDWTDNTDINVPEI